MLKYLVARTHAMLCGMRGYLRFLVLWLLHRKSLSGAQLAEEIQRRKGSKPSPGTIYPVLKDLRKMGLIQEVERNGNHRAYALTSKGKREVDAACTVFCHTFYDLRQRFR